MLNEADFMVKLRFKSWNWCFPNIFAPAIITNIVTVVFIVSRPASIKPLKSNFFFITTYINEFSKNIDIFKKAITEKNGDKLLKIFASTKNVRKEIVKAGQDVESPDFGRKKN